MALCYAATDRESISIKHAPIIYLNSQSDNMTPQTIMRVNWATYPWSYYAEIFDHMRQYHICQKIIVKRRADKIRCTLSSMAPSACQNLHSSQILHMYRRHQFLFNKPFFRRYSRSVAVTQKNFADNTLVTYFRYSVLYKCTYLFTLEARCPTYDPTNNVKALTELNVKC